MVRPKGPYLDWATNLSGEDVTEYLQEDERTVYLIPEYADSDESEQYLREAYGYIFEEELNAWHTDQSAWPKVRDLKTFKEWFAVEFHSVVLDLGSGPIRDDE